MLVRHEPSSAAAVRRELATDLDLHGVDPETIDQVTLVASELVGNAVRHAGVDEGAELDVSWTLVNDAVIVAVEDPSGEPPIVRTATPDAQSGRGLRIIEALTAEWGYEPTPRGKRVWAKVTLRLAA